ncbi:hypothetical protein XENOCAPTIV_003167 [Xenoophorus captivus]|uniref:Uncharacterized protein n=1 Tax=Xenoophorus captivus TaxID=1517983 RepID=A0ABV0SD07_9TELE
MKSALLIRCSIINMHNHKNFWLSFNNLVCHQMAYRCLSKHIKWSNTSSNSSCVISKRCEDENEDAERQCITFPSTCNNVFNEEETTSICCSAYFLSLFLRLYIIMIPSTESESE